MPFTAIYRTVKDFRTAGSLLNKYETRNIILFLYGLIYEYDQRKKQMCYENSHTVCGRIYSILQFNKSRKTVGNRKSYFTYKQITTPT